MKEIYGSNILVSIVEKKPKRLAKVLETILFPRRKVIVREGDYKDGFLYYARRGDGALLYKGDVTWKGPSTIYRIKHWNRSAHMDGGREYVMTIELFNEYYFANQEDANLRSMDFLDSIGKFSEYTNVIYHHKRDLLDMYEYRVLTVDDVWDHIAKVERIEHGKIIKWGVYKITLEEKDRISLGKQ